MLAGMGLTTALGETAFEAAEGARWETGECVYRAGRALAQKKQISPPRGALRSLAPRVATRTRPPGYGSRFCPATDPH